MFHWGFKKGVRNGSVGSDGEANTNGGCGRRFDLWWRFNPGCTGCEFRREEECDGFGVANDGGAISAGCGQFAFGARNAFNQLGLIGGWGCGGLAGEVGSRLLGLFEGEAHIDLFFGERAAKTLFGGKSEKRRSLKGF